MDILYIKEKSYQFPFLFFDFKENTFFSFDSSIYKIVYYCTIIIMGTPILKVLLDVV